MPDGPDENVHRRLRGVRNALVRRGTGVSIAAAIHFDRNGTGSAQIALEVAKGGQDESDAFALSLSPDGSELTLRVTSVSWWLNGVGSTRLTKPSPQDTTPSAPGDRYQVRFTAPWLLRISAVQGSGALDGLVLCGKSVSAPVRVHACGA